MSAPAIDWTRCLHCQGKGYTRLVMCRRCHGHGCADCDGQGVTRSEVALVCRDCRGTGRRNG